MQLDLSHHPPIHTEFCCLSRCKSCRYKTGKEAKSRRQLWHAVLSGRAFQESMLSSINREVQHITSSWPHKGAGKVGGEASLAECLQSCNRL